MFDQFKTGNPIWVYYTDIDSGANLTVPQLLRGRIGDNYQVNKKDFPTYRYVKTEGPASGQFDMSQRSVRLYYRKADWENVSEEENFLHLDKTTPVYDQVKGMPVGDPLPADITIKSFEKVTTKDKQDWYEIGADQWLLFSNMHLVDDPFNPKKEKIESRLASQLTILPLHDIKATIDYIPGKAIDIYDAPYGEKVGKLPNGKEVTITGKISDNGEITWYQLGDKQYITGNYIKINGDEE